MTWAREELNGGRETAAAGDQACSTRSGCNVDTSETRSDAVKGASMARLTCKMSMAEDLDARGHAHHAVDDGCAAAVVE